MLLQLPTQLARALRLTLGVVPVLGQSSVTRLHCQQETGRMWLFRLVAMLLLLPTQLARVLRLTLGAGQVLEQNLVTRLHGQQAMVLEWLLLQYD